MCDTRVLGWMAVVWMCAAAPASAVLVSQDHPGFGADTITLDTDTGLEWLDLTESDNRSVNDVTADLSPGGDYGGFRYATLGEVLGLFTNAGIPDVSGTSAANVGPAQALMDFIGSTNFQAGIGDGREALGALDDGTVVGFDGFDSNGTIVMTAGMVGSQGLDFTTPQVGHWLVTPEPGTLALLVIGAAAFGRRRDV